MHFTSLFLLARVLVAHRTYYEIQALSNIKRSWPRNLNLQHADIFKVCSIRTPNQKLIDLLM